MRRDARSRGRVSTDSWGWGGRREKTLQKEYKSKRGLLGGGGGRTPFVVWASASFPPPSERAGKILWKKLHL